MQTRIYPSRDFRSRGFGFAHAGRVYNEGDGLTVDIVKACRSMRKAELILAAPKSTGGKQHYISRMIFTPDA